MLTNLKAEISSALSRLTGLEPAEIEKSLEPPKKLEHGHLAFPVFPLAKTLRKAPPAIAGELAQKILAENISSIAKAEAVGGFLNLTFHDRFVQSVLLSSVRSDQVGRTSRGAGKKIVIDYSSPNVAKPLGIGHMRATMIGQAIRKLAETQGYTVIGVNHLGDWGTQFGKLAWAFEHWKDEYPFEKEPFDTLYKLYVRFHDEAEKDAELDAKGAAYFKRLEDGDEELLKLWRMFVDITMVEHNKLYRLLNVKHDLIQGEAFYNDKLDAAVERIEKAGILEESQGAQVVFINDKMPPCIIRKSDGASLYATRDVATALYRKEVLGGDMILVVVGVDQTLHFQQVFGVLEKMGLPWAKDCKHIAFGMYRFPEGKMSSRKGRTVFMEDVFTKAIDLVKTIIEEKNPDLPDKVKVAEQVAVGAVVFNDLMGDRIKDVDFNWEKALDFQGDSGPYVQYVGVRCTSLMKKWGKPIPPEMSVDLNSDEERELMRVLLNYQDTLSGAFDTFKPNIVAHYLLDVCRAFNGFYQKHRILDEAPDIAASRMALVQATHRILASGLGVLSISVPEMM